jgi:DNA-directed RNA polymerase subunit RPC12/RpoP
VAYGSESQAAPGMVDRVKETTKVFCPKCGSDRLFRTERKTFLQRRFFPLFGYFPWECRDCRKDFTLRKRYRRKSNKKQYGESAK